MEQINVYDLIGNATDPVYERLSCLKKGESTKFDDVQVTFNEFGLYELSEQSLHECFPDLEKCYKHICRIVKFKMWHESDVEF